MKSSLALILLLSGCGLVMAPIRLAERGTLSVVKAVTPDAEDQAAPF